MKYSFITTACFALTVLSSLEVQAATWINTTGDSQAWDTAGNWSGGVPNGINAVAEFKSPGAWPIGLTVSRSGAITLGNLNVTFGTNSNLILSSSSSADFTLQRSSGSAGIITTQSGPRSLTLSGRNIVLNSNLTVNSPSCIRLTAFNTTNGRELKGSGTILKLGTGTLDLNVINAENWAGDLNLQGGLVSSKATTGPASGTVLYHNANSAELSGNWGTRQINLINFGAETFKLSNGVYYGNLTGTNLQQDLELANVAIGGDNSTLTFVSSARRVVVPGGQLLTIGSTHALGAANGLPLRLGASTSLYIGDYDAPLPLTVTAEIELSGGGAGCNIATYNTTGTHHVIAGDVILNYDSEASPSAVRFLGGGGTNNLEISGQIRDAGAGGDVITQGNVTFSGTNNYTGNTTVTNAVLTVVNNDVFDDSSTVTMPGPANLNLTHSGTDVVGALVIGGIPQPNGTYTFGTGKLRVGPPSPEPQIALRGNGVLIQAGDASPDTGDHTDFENVDINGGEITRTFTIENTGTADLLLTTPDPVSASGPEAADFTLTQPVLTSIPPAGSTTFDVTFDPSVVGLRSATISVASNDATKDPYTFAIQGTGVIPPTFTWSGLGTTDNWSDGGNWDGSAPPPNDGTAIVVFGASPRTTPSIDQAWHVHGVELGGASGGVSSFGGVSLAIGAGGISDTRTFIQFTFFNLPLLLAADQSWTKSGTNSVLPRVGDGWSLDTNGHELTIGSGFFGNGEFPGSITGTGSLFIADSSYFIARGPLSLTGGIRVGQSAEITVYDTTYPGVIHGDNAGTLAFSGDGSGTFAPQLTGTFSQVQIYNSFPSRNLALLTPSAVNAGSFSGIGAVRLQLGDDGVFGTSGNFSLGGVVGDGPELEAVGGPRVLTQRLYRQYASSLKVVGPEPLTFLGGATLGGYAGETSVIDVEDPAGLLRIEGACFGSHSLPMEKRGLGTLEFAGTGNNNLTLPLHVTGGRLVLNKTSQPGGITAFGGNLRIGDDIGTEVLALLNSNQIADSVTVTLESNGVFDLGGKNETIGKLEGTGTVGNSSTTTNSVLTVAVPSGQTATFSGSLVDSLGSGSRTLGFSMSGGGTMVLGGSHSLSSMQVAAGVLEITGSLTTPSLNLFVLADGTLSGGGSIAGTVTLSDNGGQPTLAPGPGISTLSIDGGLSFVGSSHRYRVEINTNTETADRTVVDDYVSLGNGTTTLEISDLSAAAMTSGSLVILENTSLQSTDGHFSGLPEGSEIFIGPNTFILTYEGGPGGNDVILSVAPPPAPVIVVLRSNGTPLTPGLGFLEFGDVANGITKAVSITIRNDGTAPLDDLEIFIPPAPGSTQFSFVANFDPMNPLLPGEIHAVIVSFTPAGGPSDATLQISSNAPENHPFAISLMGTGVTAREAFDNVIAANSSLTGEDALPNAIPYDDGVENLLKYAFNMNLGGWDVSVIAPGTGTGGLPAVGLAEAPSGSVLRVEFVRRKGSGLTYTPKVSGNLDSFDPMTGAVTVVSIDDNWERVTAEQPCDPATTPRCFALVEVALP